MFQTNYFGFYMRDLERKCYIFLCELWGLFQRWCHKQWVISKSWVLLIKLRFNFSAILWRYFYFQLILILQFFFLYYGIPCCWGVLIRILYSVCTAEPNFTWFICCSCEENLVLVLIFFPQIYLSAILKFFRNKKKYFLTFFSVHLWLLFEFTRTCSFRVITTFTHALRCQDLLRLFVELFLQTFLLQFF